MQRAYKFRIFMQRAYKFGIFMQRENNCRYTDDGKGVAITTGASKRRNGDAQTLCRSCDVWNRLNSDALGHGVAIATSSSKCRNCDTFLSVGIATLFYRRRYSDGFEQDGKNLGKFPTFGQKRRNQVSEFPPNVVVID